MELIRGGSGGRGERTGGTSDEESDAGEHTGNRDGIGDKLRLHHVDTCHQQGRGEEDQTDVAAGRLAIATKWKANAEIR